MADREQEPPASAPAADEEREIVVVTTPEVVDTGQVVTPEARRRPLPAATEAPPEDVEVVPVGSYETWDQSGQGLDAVGAGMTGDTTTVGLTGTGFEDDGEV